MRNKDLRWLLSALPILLSVPLSGCDQVTAPVDSTSASIDLTIRERVCDPKHSLTQRTFDEACSRRDSDRDADTIEIQIDRLSHVATIRTATGINLGDTTQ